MAKRIYSKTHGEREPQQKGLYALNRITRRLAKEEESWLPFIGRKLVAPSLEDDVIDRVTNERVRQVLDRLSKLLTTHQLDILMKSEVEDMSLSEIGRQLKISEESVRTAKAKALDRIRSSSIRLDLKSLLRE